MAQGNIVAHLQLKVADFKRGMKDATNELKTFSSATSGIAKGVGKAFLTIGTVAAGAATGIGVAAIKAAADAETQLAKMETAMGGNVKEAERMLVWAKEFGKTTPFATSDVVDATVKLQAYGLSAEDNMVSIGNMAAGMGKGLDQAVEAVADAQTGELERLKEFGITKQMLVDEALKLGKGEIVNAKGQITDMDAMNEALLSIMDSRFKGGMERQAKTFSGQISTLKDNWTNFLVAIGDELMVYLKPALEQLNAWLDTIDFEKVAADAASFVKTVVEGFITVGTAIKDVIGFYKEHETLIKALALTFTAVLAPAMLGFIAHAAVMKTKALAALIMDTIRMISFNYALGLSYLAAYAPILLIIAGIALLIAAIYLIWKNWDKILEVTKIVWDKIKEVLAVSWEWIKSAFASTMSWLSEVWGTAWNAIKSFFIAIWDGIKAAGLSVWGAIVAAASVIWNGFVAVFKGIFTVLLYIFATVWFIIEALVKAVWGAIGKYIIAAWNGIKTAAFAIWDALKAYFTLVFNIYKKIITTVWNAIKVAIMAVWNVIKTAAMSVFNALKSFFTTVFNFYKTIIMSVWNAIKSFLLPIWNAIKAAATSIFEAIKSKLTSIFNAIKTVVMAVWNVIKSYLTTVFNGIKSVATSVWNSIMSVISSIINRIKSVITSVFNAIKSVVTNVWSSISSSISNAMDNIRSKVSGGASFLRDTFVGAVDKVKSSFSGMWNSIKGSLDSVVSGIKAKVTKAKDFLGELNPFKRHSPSLVDNVLAGTKVIRKTYEGLGGLQIAPPKLGNLTAGRVDLHESFGGKGNGNNSTSNYEAVVRVENMHVRNDQDVHKLGREFFAVNQSHDRAKGGR